MSRKRSTAKAPTLPAKRARGRPADGVDKKADDEISATLLRCEYLALREHMKGRRGRYGALSALGLLAKRYRTDEETIRRRMRKARKMWPILRGLQVNPRVRPILVDKDGYPFEGQGVDSTVSSYSWMPRKSK